MADNIDFPEVLKKSYDAENEGIKMILASSLVPKTYNSIELSYTGDNLTEVVYKLDGSTVATLSLSYDGTRLESVTRS